MSLSRGIFTSISHCAARPHKADFIYPPSFAGAFIMFRSNNRAYRCHIMVRSQASNIIRRKKSSAVSLRPLRVEFASGFQGKPIDTRKSLLSLSFCLIRFYENYYECARASKYVESFGECAHPRETMNV